MVRRSVCRTRKASIGRRQSGDLNMSDKRIKIAPLSLSSARQFIQFAAGSHAAEAFADDQLEGAVAIHNLLARGRLAYLGDEVGMGKTYVAMGAVALLRHFHPQLRVLYIVPK